MQAIRIGSPDDERLTVFRNVPDPQLLQRLGLFVAEGRLVVARLLASRLETRALLVTDAALASLTSVLVDRTFPVYVVPQSVMSGVTGFNFHRGCLAVGVRPPARDWREVIRDARRLVILERIGNVDNVGSIFRTAAALGVDGVLLQTDCADPLYRKAIRTSMAATLTLPFSHAHAWPDTLTQLANAGWTVAALTPAIDAMPLRDFVSAGASRIALVVGHEGEGLTRGALEACTHRVRIPTHAAVDSLNVAAAAAIAMYEVAT